MAEQTQTRKIVRFLQTDLNGEFKVEKALRKVKGVSFMISNVVLFRTGIDGKKKIGDLPEAELKKIEGFVKNLSRENLPDWMLNRRKDPETGTNAHVYGSDLQFKRMEDINFMKRTRSYKGVRHELGQPVRGQRTRSSFRTQKTVGVAKKKVQQAAKPKEEKK
jgi:small subunit ribosomal protein S13